mmetsp:Transcript_89053/g.278964  ORF Transcript_89053/g.278964 Transcript_89053/m.278964 type:complete len:227 (-) Transcript_89053:49-729(-)
MAGPSTTSQPSRTPPPRSPSDQIVKEGSPEILSATAKPAGASPAAGGRGQGDGQAVDPFLVNSATEAAEEAAALARLEELAALVQGKVRVRQQPPSKSHSSILPADAPSELHMELLVPGLRGARFETWAASEIVLGAGEEAAAERKPPLASARLLRVTKVRHLDKHDGGCSMRLRVQRGESHEVCEDILVHASEVKAKACSEALVEAINLVRLMVGRSVHEKTSGG